MHQSVLLNEVLEFLARPKARVIVDGTVGAGGHAAALLEKCDPSTKLIGFDKDPSALEIAKDRLKGFGDRVMLINEDFKNIAKVLREKEIRGVDGVLLDLGVSSMQVDQAARGFSFQKEGALDMRMDPSSSLTAKEIVNHYSKEELLDMFYTLGEERFSRRIVERILEARERSEIKTTGELSKIISAAVPGKYRFGRLHPATRTFQALRIAVNDELGALETFLKEIYEVIEDEARVAIISFHSLEDRIVKNFFKSLKQQKKGGLLTKKPITATMAEVQTNPRARSAKLRVFMKQQEIS